MKFSKGEKVLFVPAFGGIVPAGAVVKVLHNIQSSYSEKFVRVQYEKKVYICRIGSLKKLESPKNCRCNIFILNSIGCQCGVIVG